mmetsp:Transcript_13972/g.22220  ORF Transcript_13972/g.22220 Transcript_13972/m.22220 type:complete len:99 (-) Transcript_13972:49-345(-)
MIYKDKALYESLPLCIVLIYDNVCCSVWRCVACEESILAPTSDPLSRMILSIFDTTQKIDPISPQKIRIIPQNSWTTLKKSPRTPQKGPKYPQKGPAS